MNTRSNKAHRLACGADFVRRAPVGGWNPPCNNAGWLHLAATPAFGAMAVWSAVAANPMDMLCAHGMSSLNGMTLMYVLMAVFHAGPWLRMLGARCSTHPPSRPSP